MTLDARETWEDYEQQLEEQSVSDNLEVRGVIEAIEKWPDGNFKGYKVGGVLLQLSKAKQALPKWMSYQVGQYVYATYAPIQKGQYTNNYAQAMELIDSLQTKRHVDGPVNPGQAAQKQVQQQGQQSQQQGQQSQQQGQQSDRDIDIPVQAMAKALLAPGMTAEQVTAVLNTAKTAWKAFKRPAAQESAPARDDFDDDIPFS